MRIPVLFSLLAALLLVVGASGAKAAVPSDSAIASFVEAYLEREVRHRKIPGAAIIVVRDGRPILARGFGVANLDERAAIDVDRHLFRQGSISKLFGWILAVQLAEQGRLDLDRDVNAYLDFAVPAKFGRPVTMRHMMTHSAGFSDRIPLIEAGHDRLPLGARLRENMPELVYPPGARVSYSNYGAALAGYIVERLSGAPFERLVEKRIFAPVGMTSATFAQPLPAPLATGLVANYSASSRRPHQFEYIGLAPAGSLSATPTDMGRFVAALLAGGQGTRGRILSSQSIETMTRLQRPLARGMTAGLGLGFLVAEYKGVAHVGHGGSMIAAATDLQLLPAQKLGWILNFSGRGLNGSAIPLRQELLRAVIDRFYAIPAPVRVRAELSTADSVAGAYVPARRMHSGVLQLASLNMLKIRSAAGGELRIAGEEGDSRWLPVGRDRFVEAQTSLPLTVARDSNGRIVSLASPYLNAVTDYEPAPIRLKLGLPVLLGAPVAILLAALGLGLGGVVRRLRGRAAVVESGFVRRLAPWALALVTITLLGWAAYALGAMAFPDAAADARWALLLLKPLGLIGCAAAVVLVADAALGWRRRRPVALLLAGLGALGAVGLSWLLLAFGLAGLPGSA